MDNLDSLSQVCPKACLSDDSVKLTVNVNYHRQGNTTLQIVSGVVYEALWKQEKRSRYVEFTLWWE